MIKCLIISEVIYYFINHIEDMGNSLGSEEYEENEEYEEEMVEEFGEEENEEEEIFGREECKQKSISENNTKTKKEEEEQQEDFQSFEEECNSIIYNEIMKNICPIEPEESKKEIIYEFLRFFLSNLSEKESRFYELFIRKYIGNEKYSEKAESIFLSIQKNIYNLLGLILNPKENDVLFSTDNILIKEQLKAVEFIEYFKSLSFKDRFSMTDVEQTAILFNEIYMLDERLKKEGFYFNKYFYQFVGEGTPEKIYEYFIETNEIVKDLSFTQINQKYNTFILEKTENYPQYNIPFPVPPTNAKEICPYLGKVQQYTEFLSKTENEKINRYDIYKKIILSQYEENKNKSKEDDKRKEREREADSIPDLSLEEKKKIYNQILQQYKMMPIKNWEFSIENTFPIMDEERNLLLDKIEKLEKKLKEKDEKIKELGIENEEKLKKKEEEIKELKLKFTKEIKEFNELSEKQCLLLQQENKKVSDNLKEKERILRRIRCRDLCSNFLGYFDNVAKDEMTDDSSISVYSTLKALKEKYKDFYEAYSMDKILIGVKDFKDEYNSEAHSGTNIKVNTFIEEVSDYIVQKDEFLTFNEEEEKKSLKEIFDLLFLKLKDLKIFVTKPNEMTKELNKIEVEKNIKEICI